MHYFALIIFVWSLQMINCGRGYRQSSANEPGVASLTTVKHFTFLQKLGNPCSVSHFDSTRVYQDPVDATPSPINEFYEAIVTGILLALQKVQDLENSDPNLPDCNGLYLKSLPATPPLATMNIRELFQQVYQSGIYLAAHLHIMSLDRQVINRNGRIIDDQVIEDPNQFTAVTTLRCGNESDSFATILRDLTSKIEDVLCTLISGSTTEQRASYRQPYNSLLRTQIYRYHSSCSLLQTRDCLLVKETKIVLNNMAKRFNQLLNGTDISQLQNNSGNFELENSV